VRIGIVEGIYIAPARGEPTESVDQIHVVAGKGIEGDRFYLQSESKDIQSKTDREITLIEIETIDAIYNEDGIKLTPDQTRRNIVTRGISLNDLVGHVFSIGEIKLLGIRLCEPCSYLASRTDPRVLHSMAHRGGLRAKIITDGMIHINDMISISD
jgi:MOSC domain-containing protein YiiM